MATQSGLQLTDIQSAQAGLTRDDIATRANQVVAQQPSGSITSDVLSGNPKPLTLPPPTVQTLTTGTQDYIASQNESIKTAQQQELDQMQKSLASQKDDILGLIEGIGNSQGIKNDLYKKEGVDKAKKEVDEFTSRLEAEQHSNRRRIEAIQKNPEGLFAGGMEQEVNRVNSESLTKQADLAILQNNALRRYSTAAEIADRAVEAKLEPMKAKLEGLKFFYAENKADFDKKDDRAYAELIKQEERNYVTQKENITKAFTSGLRTTFINEGGKIYRASDGKEYSDPRSFLQDAGVSSFEEAYQKGLVGDLTFERVADMDFVSQLRGDYPDAYISPTDTAEEAVNKLAYSNKYKKEYATDPMVLETSDGTKYVQDPATGEWSSVNDIVGVDSTTANGKPLSAEASKLKANTESGLANISAMERMLTDGGTVKIFTPNAFSQTRKQYFTQADNLVDVIGRLRSGGAITTEEESRFRSLLPKVLDDQGTWRGKLTQLKTLLRDVERNLGGGTQDIVTSGSVTPDGNQVKGMTQKAEPLPYLDPNTFQPVPTKTGGASVAPNIQKLSPSGSVGGQCGVWVRNVVNKLGATYPRLGDGLKAKIAAVQKYGTSPTNAKIGSVIVTRENPTYGHVAYIIGRNAKGWIVGESNFKQSNRVSYGRVIPFNSPKLVGVINPTRRTA